MRNASRAKLQRNQVQAGECGEIEFVSLDGAAGEATAGRQGREGMWGVLVSGTGIEVGVTTKESRQNKEQECQPGALACRPVAVDTHAAFDSGSASPL